MKIAVLVTVVLIALLSLAGISRYLSVDDLASCKSAPSRTAPCQAADAIIAVSGGNTSARTREAIELYKAGWADTIVFSGAAQDTSGPSNAEVMSRQAIEAGVLEQDIVIEEASRTTKENAEQTKQLLESRSIDRVILVTSGYHQRRASLEFHLLAGAGTDVVNHPTSYDEDWTSLWWITPRGWWLAGGEILKIIAFYVGGTR